MTTVIIGQRSLSAAPDRSLTQRRDALERANIVRIRRSQLKRDIKAGRVNVIALLANPPEYVETMKVFDLLLAVPTVATVKANKILTQCRVSPSKTVGGLSVRQRAELATLLSRPSSTEDKAAYQREYREFRVGGRCR